MNKPLIEIVKYNRLTEKFDLDPNEIEQIIRKGAINAYEYYGCYIDGNPPWSNWGGGEETDKKPKEFIELNDKIYIPFNYEKHNITNAFFFKKDIEEFGSNHPELIKGSLTKTEAQELGRLRREKKKHEDTLKVIGELVCWQVSQKYKLTRKILKTFMQDKFPEHEGKTFNERLWKAVPKEIKNSGGGNSREPM